MRQRSSLLAALLSTSLLVIGGCQSVHGKRFALFPKRKADQAAVTAARLATPQGVNGYAAHAAVAPANDANWRAAKPAYDVATEREASATPSIQLARLRLPESMHSAPPTHAAGQTMYVGNDHSVSVVQGEAIVLPAPDGSIPGPPRVYDLSMPPEYYASITNAPAMVVPTMPLEGSSCPPGGCGNSACSQCGSHGETKHIHVGHKDKKTLLNAANIKPFWKRDNERRDLGKNNLCVPRELRLASHPLYVVEPPDVLYIEALQLLPNRPIAGERLVRQDGTISLGYYGEMHVAGLTLREIEAKLRQWLTRYVRDPQVYVDVASFNSKVYYVLGEVQQQGRLPITGKETVLDAITLAGGLNNFAKVRDIHVARPNPGGGCDQILWVDWQAVSACADTYTNYQLMPGDRVIVPRTGGAQALVFMDNFLAPIERVVSVFSLLRFAFDDN